MIPTKQMVAACCLLLTILVGGCDAERPAAGAIPVDIVRSGDRFQVLRGGQPYPVHGAGIEFGDMAAFAAHGGTSFRTWRTDNGVSTGQEVLDAALANGLTVAMCIEIGRERHGFDYDDEAAVAAQLEYARQEVLKYRDHPALLAWVIGNEPNLEYSNPNVFDAIDEISRMIHELDPNHPTTTALAGFSKDLGDVIAARAPDLDFLSIQMYGDIVNLPRYVEEAGYEKPYFVTEWGAIGHWEVGKTAWGAPIEQDSSTKADTYLRAYETVISPNTDQIIGAYVFLWGQKQERTPTWYGMFTPSGLETETVDVMHYIWNGRWPDNRTPRLHSLQLDGSTATDNIRLAPGQTASAVVDSVDPDGDSLTYRWLIMGESSATQTGGDLEAIPETLEGLIGAGAESEADITAPHEPGAYRLFVYVEDGQGHAAHANIPFLVE
jgi:hypothetical protein